MNLERCILLIADGARADVFEDLFKTGKLPNVSKLFDIYDSTYRSMVSCFPTTTGPAYTPFLTGCFPASCNIPGIRWLDRKKFSEKGLSLFKIRSYVGLESYLMDYDLSTDTKTLFELFNKPLCLFSSLSRGIGFDKLKTFFARIPLIIKTRLIDKNLDAVERYGQKKFFKALRNNSDFLFYAAHAIDDYSHRTDPHSEKTMTAYTMFDDLVGKTIDELKKQNKIDSTLIIITSDHGHSEIKTHCDLTGILENFGLNTLYYPKIFKKWSKVKASVMVSGNSMAHVYLKNGDSWQKRCFTEDIEANYKGLLDVLLANHDIEFLVTLNRNKQVVVLGKDGKSIIEINGDKVSYQFTGKDPLDFGKKYEFKDNREILDLTFKTNFPDAIFQLSSIFNTDRTGDIIVNARAGYDLRKGFEIPEHTSTHGSLRAEHMLVPFYINKKITDENLRTIDIFPSILDLFNKKYPKLVEGKSFVLPKA